MSLTFGFYNSINGDRVYDAIQMGQIFDGIITDGIYATYLKAMVVKASDNASEVIVQPGRAWFNHTWTYIDADYPVEAPAPEVILDRVDTLVLDINAEYSNRENKILWVTGTPASVNPEAPSLINTTTHHQYPLCNVYRKAGTTMIYAADITNRVGTSATPFVTGVLTGINIDDLLSQWDDEFHTWENATKTSFEGWMVNQQSVYTTWFNSIRSQMAGDLDEFEAWFETIKGIIDEEAATHLQAEIDELKDMLPAGSHIDISTTEPTLYSRNVTVSDGVHSKTVQFNASGSATVESFPYIGSIEVTSTDGERTATSNISIPYFGRYNTTLAFWAARVNLKGSTELGGYTVTVKDHLDVTVTSIVLNAEGNGTFTATYPDTYKFVYTYGGQTMETTLQVTQETTYEVEIHGGFNYQAWLTAGRVSKSFSSLDDILADEKTLRQLFLVHDSVDYLANANVNSDVEKIFNTDLAAKWINNSDYALDKFYAVADIKTVMDTADKYGYGEWVNNNGTWGPKGNVPKMTSNTAPYGEASATSSAGSGYEAFRAFDGDDSTQWASRDGVTDDRLQYKFSNPICPKRVTFKARYLATLRVKTFSVLGSNDGTNWETIREVETLPNTSTEDYARDLNCEKYYLYLALGKLTSYAVDIEVKSLQFYGRELKVSVPTMTSNTAPFGVAGGTSVLNNQSSDDYYTAFNGNSGGPYNGWLGNTNANERIYYKFPQKVCVKLATFSNRNYAADSNGRISTFKVQASNDGINWIDKTDVIDRGAVANAANYKTVVDLSNNTEYQYWAIFGLTAFSSYIGCVLVNFYSKDYSEKEFEVGTTKKWLYDHGVELVDLSIDINNGATITKRNSDIYINKSNSDSVDGVYATQKIDCTNYSLLRAKAGNEATYSSENRSVVVEVIANAPHVYGSVTQLAVVNVNKSNVPNNIGVDISSINQSASLEIAIIDAVKCTITEWWLE